MFALGVAAAAAAWTQFPLPPENPADRSARAQAKLKHVLDHKPLDTNALAELAQEVSAEAEQNPAANFAAGSAFVALAESTAPLDASLWARAKEHFAKVDEVAMTDALERKRLLFRRAKAVAATASGDPKALITALTSLPSADEPEGELRRLLADTFLRMNPPDVASAARELTTYLGGPTKLQPADLARYRLKAAEAFLSLDNPLAQSWLKSIDASAAADTRCAAKYHLARLMEKENNWKEAVKLYGEALQGAALPADQRAMAEYRTGIDCIQMKTPDAAVPHFEAVLKDKELGPAAAVRLAELTLRSAAPQGDRGKVLDLLDVATRDVAPGTGFRNQYVALTDLQAVFEETIQAYTRDGDFDGAARAIEGYGKVATAGRDREKRAELNLAWANALRDKPATAARAVAKYKEAAAEYSALATNHPTATGAADLYHRAAACQRLAGDDKAALSAIEKITQYPDLPAEVAAAAWVEKGDALIAGSQYADGIAALEKALTAPGPSATVARVKIAIAYLDQARALAKTSTAPATQTEAQKLMETGQNLLAQVAASGPAESQAEREAQQQALYEFGKLLVAQQNLPDAEAQFRKLIQTYPTAPLAPQSKLWLGSTLLLIARGDGPGGRPPADADRKLAEALKLFQDLSGASDTFTRTQADLRLAHTTLLLKKYDDMPALSEKLAVRYRGHVEELIVQSMLCSAYLSADRPESAARTLSEMTELYGKVPASDFNDSADEYRRAFWPAWFEQVKTQIAKRQQPKP
ncbi:hypothetical protein FRUB_06712 [Fimbriiglobus ruber]|uniref:Uncharacterized protein n=1 Tax=Fimbriiglobus ruber TaxID=1908690 RepID=A0A225D809_9BACT|nr:hypothetical protein FRUB_06712 [Fimbriiglobus ruber]